MTASRTQTRVCVGTNNEGGRRKARIKPLNQGPGATQAARKTQLDAKEGEPSAGCEKAKQAQGAPGEDGVCVLTAGEGLPLHLPFVSPFTPLSRPPPDLKKNTHRHVPTPFATTTTTLHSPSRASPNALFSQWLTLLLRRVRWWNLSAEKCSCLLHWRQPKRVHHGDHYQ
jgi:hypothetical protein